MRILSRHASHTLVAFGGEGDRSAAQLLTDAAALAAALTASLPPATSGQDVMIVGRDRYNFAVSLLAAWSLGHAVALPPNAQDGVIRAMAAGSNILALLHDSDEDIGIDVRACLGGAPDESLGAPTLEPARRVAVVHTSGTSGQARAHAKTAAQLLGEAEALAEHFGVGPGTRLVGTVPSHHIYGLLFSVLVPLVGGGAIYRRTPLHAEAVAGALAEHDARVLVSVPAHLRALRLLDTMPALDTVFSSGAPLMPALAAELLENFGVVVTEVLGSTETGGMAWRRTDGDGTWAPLPGVDLASDAHGRLLVDSPFLPPDAVRPHRSEDRVELREGGRFVHLGRLDDVVKVAGKRVALGDVERRTREIEGVLDVALAAVEVGGARGNELIAVVVAPGLTPDMIRSRLRQFFDPVVLPRKLKLVDAIERDERGKLAKKEVLATYERSPTARLEAQLGRVAVEEDGETRVVQVDIRAPRDLYWFRGHFASYPLLPGVVQLDLAAEQAREAWDDLESLTSVVKLKFKRPIRPGDDFMLRLRRRADRSRVDFEFEGADGLASSGVLKFVGRGSA